MTVYRPEPVDGGGSAAPLSHDDGYASLLRVVAVTLRGLPIVLVCSLLLGGVGAAGSIFRGSSFTATSTLFPETSGDGPSRLAGLASSVGISIPRSGEGESLWFYASLLKSSAILGGVLHSQFAAPVSEGGDVVEGDLLSMLAIEGADDGERVAAGLRELDDAVSVSMDEAASLLTLRTTAGSAELSEQLNRRILDLLREFNLERRQSRASAERAFIEARLEEARLELEDAEDALQSFLTENRRYEDTSPIAVDVQRLQRRVGRGQQVYSTLAQGYEEARIEEVRNTPVVTIIDVPEGSARPVGGIVIDTLIGIFLGGLLGVLLVFGREYVRRARVYRPAEFGEVSRLLRLTSSSGS